MADKRENSGRRSYDDIADNIKDFVREEFISHEVRETELINKKISEVMAAFPDKDIAGHHDYHEAKLEAAKAEEKFWNELKLDLAKKGLWSIVTILSGMVVLGFAAWVGMIGPGSK